jgi:hypothetical protein
MRKYDTVDFVMMPASEGGGAVQVQPSLTTFDRADGSKLEVLNDSTGTYRIVTPGNPNPFYGRAHEIVYQSTLAREFLAQRALR